MPGGPKEANYIPAEPLLRYIARRWGDLKYLPGTGVRELVSIGKDDRFQSEEVVDRTAEERERYERVRRQILQAVSMGRISLWVADAICCDHLGVHPVEVYGMDWFDFGTPITGAHERWVERWVYGAAGRGSANGSIDPEKVIEIRRRRANGEAAALIALRYDIGEKSVRDIVARRTYAWVPEEGAAA